jgi:3D (Asp-Asp-Asp) domain-containing protein
MHGVDDLLPSRQNCHHGCPMRNASLLFMLALLLGGSGCFVRDIRWTALRPPAREPYREYVLETTGYCPCGICCGWRRNWFGRPVVAAGPHRGEPKLVGYTASGERALPGTTAADASIFPFGTIMLVPGYGYGRVEDRGADIRGYRIDLYFRSHGDAEVWGRSMKKVKVWPPPHP